MKYIFLFSKLAFLYFFGLNLAITLVLLNKAYSSASRYLYMGFIVALLNYFYGLWVCVKVVLLLMTFMMLLYKDEALRLYNVVKFQLKMDTYKNENIDKMYNILSEQYNQSFGKLEQLKSYEKLQLIYTKVQHYLKNKSVQTFLTNIDKALESFYNLCMEAFDNFLQKNTFINNLKNNYISYNDFDKLKDDDVIEVDLNDNNTEMNRSLDELMKGMPTPEQMFTELNQNNMSVPPDPMTMMNQMNDMIKMLDTLQNLQPHPNMKKFS